MPFSLFKSLFYKNLLFQWSKYYFIGYKIWFWWNWNKSKKNHSFNFLIIGEFGTAKSTFINIINWLKVTKEGTGGGKVYIIFINI